MYIRSIVSVHSYIRAVAEAVTPLGRAGRKPKVGRVRGNVVPFIGRFAIARR